MTTLISNVRTQKKEAEASPSLLFYSDVITRLLSHLPEADTWHLPMG